MDIKWPNIFPFAKEDVMYKRFNLFCIVCITILPFIFVLYSHAEPLKPGTDFVWLKSHTTSNGISIPCHWKHVKSSKKEKVWIPGHHALNGKWVPGHWKSLSPTKKDSAWVLGQHGPNGRWIPGHWR